MGGSCEITIKDKNSSATLVLWSAQIELAKLLKEGDIIGICSPYIDRESYECSRIVELGSRSVVFLISRDRLDQSGDTKPLANVPIPERFLTIENTVYVSAESRNQVQLVTKGKIPSNGRLSLYGRVVNHFLSVI